jgi:hypothetical protein
LLKTILSTTDFQTLFLILRDQIRLLYAKKRIRRDATIHYQEGSSDHV